jgi:CubicO group peptidase (beta-lactamase class C family)
VNRVVILLSCLALLVSSPAPGLASANDKGAADERIDELFARFDETTPGVAVGVVKDGELVFARSAGMADLTFAIPFTVDTPTNIGSTAKQFTGFALALLHERGALSLDDDIRQYITELPDFGETVTLRHLAAHTSGYREFLNALALTGRLLDKGDWIDADEAIELVTRQPALQNAPGAEWNYNNTGYLLLARVIAQVTGRPFDEWMQDEVFEPLGMHDSLLRTAPDVIVRGGSSGYVKSEESWLEARDLGGALGAGCMYTTIGDMARWMRHLGRLELGGYAVRDLMTTPFTLTDGETTNYGLGLIIDTSRGLDRWQHGGGDMGHMSVFHYYPDLDGGLLVFANHHDLGPDFVRTLTEIFFADHLEPLPDDAEEPTDLAVDALAFEDAMFDRYTGRYELEVMPGFVLTFFRDDARYMTQATGQQAVEITPLDATSFKIVGVDARVVFVADDEGRFNELTLYQNGEHRALRLPDEDQAPAPDLGELAGRYFSDELETFYTVEVEDGRLQLLHRRFGPVALNRIKDDAYSGAFPVFMIDFERGEGGDVKGLRAGNGRARDVYFERVE